jgi:hypothetical protein
LELPLESELEPDVCCRASSSSPECRWDKHGFPLTNKLVVCSTCQFPKEEAEINEKRNNLARLQMLRALPHRLLPKRMNVQSEAEQIVKKSAASKIGYVRTRSYKTEVGERRSSQQTRRSCCVHANFLRMFFTKTTKKQN